MASTREPDQTAHTHMHVKSAHIITFACVRLYVRMLVAKRQAKGPKANKEPEERSSRKLISHFIPLRSASSLCAPAAGWITPTTEIRLAVFISKPGANLGPRHLDELRVPALNPELNPSARLNAGPGKSCFPRLCMHPRHLAESL
ncbi:unnamed protein product [Pleuronectes platessa]|uniref:Uncharacterized protein n=1 Tax=Pleuronectes platessa TaxID=8262 RepID=A0A9N7ZDL5_PLEPL|nr:unnamed protein product [Pleuronectes platessa]